MIEILKKTGLKKYYDFIIILFSLVLFIGMFFISYQKININKVEPKEFNIGYQNASISVKGSGFKDGDGIYINNMKQETTFGNDRWITCCLSNEFNKKSRV
ncbi:TPA: hypothetical protein ACG3RE_000078 [Clostridioides difficile]